jgi:hypothetical protein
VSKSWKLDATKNTEGKEKGNNVVVELACCASTVRDGAIAGLSLDGDGQIFLKNLRDTSFNKDLLNEPNFGRIHLAGQNL